MANLVTFTEPKLCTYKLNLSKDWFVHFRITHTASGVTVPKQIRGGINKIKILKLRIIAGEVLVSRWKKKLDEGWSPFEKSTTPDEMRAMNFKEAIQFALKQCKSEVSKATYRAYRLTAEKIFATGSFHILYSPISKIERAHIKILLNAAKEKFKWSNKRYNLEREYLCAIVGRLSSDDWNIISHNPAEKIKALRITETKKFVAYTAAEKEKIREYFYLNHYRYFVVLMIIYHTGARPKEILALKIKHILLEQRTIMILPDLDEENSKTKNIRELPINNELYPFLRELHLEDYDPELYVFGSCYPTGCVRKGRSKHQGVMHPDYFKPSMIRIKRDTITRFWRKVDIEILKINKYQYAMKHTGGDDKILAGVSLDALRKMYGHHSKQMTENYVEALKAVHRKEIIERSPAF